MLVEKTFKKPLYQKVFRNVLFVDFPFLPTESVYQKRSFFLWTSLAKNFNGDLLLLKKEVLGQSERKHEIAYDYQGYTGYNSIFRLEACHGWGFLTSKKELKFNAKSLADFYGILRGKKYDIIFFRSLYMKNLIRLAGDALATSLVVVDVEFIPSLTKKLLSQKKVSLQSLGYFFESLRLKRLEQFLANEDFLFFFNGQYCRKQARREARYHGGVAKFIGFSRSHILTSPLAVDEGWVMPAENKTKKRNEIDILMQDFSQHQQDFSLEKYADNGTGTGTAEYLGEPDMKTKNKLAAAEQPVGEFAMSRNERERDAGFMKIADPAHKTEKGRYLILFLDSIHHAQEEMLEFMMEDIYPRIKELFMSYNIQLYLVESETTLMPERYKKLSWVEVKTVFSVSDELLKGAVALLAPLPQGLVRNGGLPSSERILQAAGLHIPIITTASAILGLELGPKEVTLVSENKYDSDALLAYNFSYKLGQMLNGSYDIAGMAERCYRKVLRLYSWKTTEQQLINNLYTEIEIPTVLHVVGEETIHAGAKNHALSLATATSRFAKAELVIVESLMALGEHALEHVKIFRFKAKKSFHFFEQGKPDKDHAKPLFSEQLHQFLLKKRRIKLLHLYGKNSLSMQTAFLAMQKNIPYVLSLLEGDEWWAARNKQPASDAAKNNRASSYDLLNEASALICASEKEREQLTEKFPNKLIVCLSPLINQPLINQPEKQEINLAGSDGLRNVFLKKRILFCFSTFTRQANQKILVEMLHHLDEQGFLEEHLVLAGYVEDASYMLEIEELAESLELSHRLSILPQPKNIVQDELRALYARSFAFFLPWDMELFDKTSLLEAWQHRVPVIASDLACFKKFIKHGVNGLLEDSTKAERLAKCYRELQKNEKLRNYITLKGYEHGLRQYSLPITVAELKNVYSHAADYFSRSRKVPRQKKIPEFESVAVLS